LQNNNNNNNTSSTLFHTVPHSHQSPEISSERHEANKNHNSQEPEGKMGSKRLHGQFPRSLDEGLIDKEQSYRWLKFGDIKGETESVIMAAQDQAISTNYF
jgi:hypothetical protein